MAKPAHPYQGASEEPSDEQAYENALAERAEEYNDVIVEQSPDLASLIRGEDIPDELL